MIVKKWKKVGKIIGVFLFVMMLTYIGIYAIARMMPKLPINQANSFDLYDIHDELFTASNQKEWVSLDEISPYVIDATLAIEDKHFYEHQGFDFLRIAKALFINFTSGETKQGASTITQQYAKNLFLDFDKTWERKIEEAWLTIRLEAHYSKDKILEGYLNTINYGGVFGIENASQYYYGKKAKDLTLAEASILAGIPKDPTHYSPISNLDAAKERQSLILNFMVENQYITEEEKEKAETEELTFVGEENEYNLSTLMYYQDAVMKELKSIKTIPSSFLKTGGLKIYTNLDPTIQKNMEDSMNKNLSENPDLEVASVVMESASGKVLALTGGRDYKLSQYNRATSAKRQVGSSIKPFLYYDALENGFTPSTTFKSEKTTFTFQNNTSTYSPENYNSNYPNKQISMAAALAYSDNIYAVKTHLFLGEESLVNTMKRVGIQEELKPIPSLALGTIEINLLDMMEGYNTLASGGDHLEPYLIRKITDQEGNVLYEKKEEKENVLNRSVVFVLNEMLTNSYASEFIDYNYPTCINLAPKITKKYAIKTGTTNTDHLIFGYNQELLMGIWAGYDDNRESDVKDGNYIKNMWVDTMEASLKEIEGDGWYEIPSNVVGVLVDPISGKPANESTQKKKMLYYIKGSEPFDDFEELDNLIPTMKTE